ncbi:hypothetical protein LGK95_18425 [Clostridium algoriphilum]|uniref:hypothetical protein n=1 Tax=Clostridium algoriphilum TaxID=198347 RepID=UPI001CF2E190|nr:hypothetical protein [Clostridium algoriphilum]MCB2295461.1 hypothetical protein [Clostridium algoriphilum]
MINFLGEIFIGLIVTYLSAFVEQRYLTTEEKNKRFIICTLLIILFLVAQNLSTFTNATINHSAFTKTINFSLTVKNQ